MNKILTKIGTPLISILAGLLVGMIILGVSGYGPFILLSGMFKGMFGSVYNFGNFIAMSVPLILTGLSVGFAYKTGLFNIGAEGQFQVATITSSVVAVNSDLPFGLSILVAVLAGMIAGSLWAAVPGVLKAYYQINEVVVTIMMNWIAFYITNYYILNYFHQEKTTSQTPVVPTENTLDIGFLDTLTNGSRLNAGIFIAVLAVIVYWYVLQKTKFGYEIKAVGHSADGARYAGINSRARIIQTMLISGAFAGLAGATYALTAPYYQATLSSFRGFGFDGIAVAMLGQLGGIGIFFSGLLLGALRSATPQLNGVPSEVSDVIIGVIIIFSALGPIIIKKIVDKRGAKDGQ